MLDISWMRWVDQTIGSAACSALAAARRIKMPFARQPRDYRKIAVFKFFGIGSIVVASPSLQALRDAYPNARLYFVTFKSNREILDILGLVDEVILIDNSSAPAFIESTLKAARELAREGIDLAVDFEFFARFPLVLASLARIPIKAGFYLTLEPWRRSLLDVHGYYNHYYHTKDIFLSMVYLLATGDRYYLDFDAWRARYQYARYQPPPLDVARVRRLLSRHGYVDGQRLVLINPNAAVELAPRARKWPEARYSQLAATIAGENPDVFVALVGPENDANYVKRVASGAGMPRVQSLAGEMTLTELIALLSLCDLFVTNDSGPMHLACLVEARIIGLFFADTPTLFAPLAPHAEVVAPSLYSVPLYTVYSGKIAEEPDNIPARSISVDMVMEKVRAALQSPPEVRTASEPRASSDQA